MKWVTLNEHRLTAEPSGELELMMMTQGDLPVFDTSHIEAVEEAISSLSQDMQDVLLAVFYEQVPYSELGERLGVSKTQAWRKAKIAIAQMSRLLHNNSTITERYGVHTNWESAAKAAIDSFGSSGMRPADMGIIDFCAREISASINNGKEPPSYSFSQIAIEAVHELRANNVWDPQAFLDLLVGKQRDYGHGNINAFGLTGVGVRIHDKVARLRNLLMLTDPPTNEPLLDTWHDLIGYAVIAEMLYNDTFNLELENK